MALNQASIDLIKEFEGWRADAYVDPATSGEPITIGYGHTSAAGLPKVKLGMTITKTQGEEILRRDLEDVERTVDSLVRVPINENQRGALVSFTYNLGGGNFAKSTLLKKVNAKDFPGAAGEFKKWNKAAGKVMAGLTRRRSAEAKLFSTPVAATAEPETVIIKSPAGPPIVTTPAQPQGNGKLITVLASLVIGLGAGAAKLMGWM